MSLDESFRAKAAFCLKAIVEDGWEGVLSPWLMLAAKHNIQAEAFMPPWNLVPFL